jgi:multiple sugar transport system ATP-binding protein
MDEPLSNLDAKQRVTMRSEIKQIHRSVGATTIYVTHDQTEAMTMSDRIVVMKAGGYVQQIGTPYELYFYPRNLFVAGFIGEPPMNFLKGTVNGGKFTNDAGLSLDITPLVKDVKALEGKKVVFAFRPEAIKVVKGGKAGANEYIINSNVDLTELLGDTTNVYANVGDVNVILKVNPHDTPEIGSDFAFAVPYKAAYIYDAETELAVESDIVRQ